jgi:hypothetical protein
VQLATQLPSLQTQDAPPQVSQALLSFAGFEQTPSVQMLSVHGLLSSQVIPSQGSLGTHTPSWHVPVLSPHMVPFVTGGFEHTPSAQRSEVHSMPSLQFMVSHGSTEPPMPP